MRKIILITGASGFFGAWLAKYYIQQGYEVVSILHDFHPVSTDKLLGISDKIHWCIGDIVNRNLTERIIAKYDISKIIHAAAMPIEKSSYQTVTSIFETNVMGTISILEAAKNAKYNGFPIKVLYISSDKAYGDLGKTEYIENSLFNPTSMYSCSKSCADLLASSFSKTFEVPLSVIRLCNLYGGGDLNSRIIPNTIRSCLEGKPPIIYSGIDSVREYMHVWDACLGSAKIFDNINEKTFGEIYNCGSGHAKTQEEIINEITKHFPHLNPKIKEAEFYRKKEIAFQKLNSSKIMTTLGWKPTITFEDGIKRTILEYREYGSIRR